MPTIAPESVNPLSLSIRLARPKSVMQGVPECLRGYCGASNHGAEFHAGGRGERRRPPPPRKPPPWRIAHETGQVPREIAPFHESHAEIMVAILLSDLEMGTMFG